MRAAAAVLLAASLVGCASNSKDESPWLVQRDAGAPRSCEPLTADQELVLGLSRDMGSSGRLHAALANLERLPTGLPQVRLNKARLLRLMGHNSEAETLYRRLLNSCLVAEAQHGLGQIEAARGRYPEAQKYLRTAASLSPASEAIRNDLGVVYMNQRRLSEARFELLTAMELNENALGAARNMLTLLVYQGNWQAAQELVSARGLTSTDFSRAEQRARDMRSQDASAATPAAAAVPSPATPEPEAMTETVATQPAPAASVPPVGSVATPPVSTPVATPARSVTPMPLSAAVRAWTAEQTTTSANDAPQQVQDAQQAPPADARPIVCRSSGASTPGLTVMECLPE